MAIFCHPSEKYVGDLELEENMSNGQALVTVKCQAPFFIVSMWLYIHWPVIFVISAA